MTPLLTKITAVSAGVVGVTGGGVAIYFTTASDPKVQKDVSNVETDNTKLSVPPKTDAKDKTIISLLKGKTLLTKNSGDESKWTAPWQSFKEEYSSKSPEDPWKFANWTQNKERPETFTSFKDQCITLGGQKVSGTDDLVFVAVEKYCTATT
ncbi:hypothetical protein A6V39_03490 [Candidatus Mycoplasma haematobovis]|uniref:Uncharacterized protein n=1 Tax=Candidatus Mycoplasma haematobovis TaxID=432608 RepID=A0A1A9QE13_9MOLU|nr:hypothetical protein [Candidatus Mycoplasma haematobovis]OAL09949.1 hypothetical protein A6V39_03490 [Candidatus Mycoplasma haematobovis]